MLLPRSDSCTIQKLLNRLQLSTDLKVEQWISQAEAARLRGVSRQAIAKLAKAKRIRALEIGGHQLVHREDVLRFEPNRAGRPKSGA